MGSPHDHMHFILALYIRILNQMPCSLCQTSRECIGGFPPYFINVCCFSKLDVIKQQDFCGMIPMHQEEGFPHNIAQSIRCPKFRYQLSVLVWEHGC